MGQQPIKKNNLTQKVFAHVFESDPRLTEQVVFIPELFSGPVESQIKNVQKLKNSIPHHQIQDELIDGINDRFTLRIQSQNPQKQTHHKFTHQKSFQKTPNMTYKQIYELANMDRFVEVLKKIEHHYHIGRQLDKLLRIQNIGKKITVRKKLSVHYTSCFDKNMYAKLYLHFYLLLLKKNLTSRDEQKKTTVNNFHKDIGKMICQMIEYNHLQEQKMLQLLYKMVIVDKLGQVRGFDGYLREIKDQFWALYLKKEHSLILDPAYCEQVRQISRCYLDELYLRSIKEAQDPDIIVDANEGLGIVRNFPILRVKDKNR